MGKLDSTPADTTVVVADIADAASLGLVNGPEDLLDWDHLDWRDQERWVQRLRHRIFTATRAGDFKRVRNLQKLMLRSRANTLVSVRRVTERNAGRRTPGVDGQVALTSPERAGLAMMLHRRAGTGHVLPVRRVYIPKRMANVGLSEFRSSLIAPSNSGYVMRWNRNGRPGWTVNNTVSVRGVDAMTRST